MLITLTILLSFIGSLPFGMINLNVMYAELTEGRKAALALAVGAALVECVQGIVAAIVFSRLIVLTSLTSYFRLLAMVVFLGLAVYYLIKTKNRFDPGTIPEENSSGPFMKGLLLSSLNFLAIPFWLTILVFISDKIDVYWDVLHWIVFGIGAGIGGFLASMAYAFIGKKWIKKSNDMYAKLDYIMAALFLLLALIAYFY